MTERIGASCCIAGGGLAGLLLRYLLARGGVRTAVLALPARLFAATLSTRRRCACSVRSLQKVFEKSELVDVR